MTELECDKIPPTEVIYYSYEGNFQLECNAKVVWSRSSNAQLELALDQTVMHAQGGGQPTDIGVITIVSGQDTAQCTMTSAIIEKVTMDRETKVITHAGKSASPSSFKVGSTVLVSVDAERRRILSECHTAGHVVDAAMARCNRVFPASKAYHFLDGPYVEYKGNVPPDERDDLLKQLQQAFKALVKEAILTEIQVVDRNVAQEECARLQENFKISDFTDEEKVRIVTVAGWTCPCGGTHVRSSQDLEARKWGITGLKCKKGVVRVKYGQNA